VPIGYDFGLCSQNISSSVSGIIFAAYPAGIAITSPFAATIVSKMGTRTAICSGVFVTAVMTVAFGLVPYISDDLVFQQVGFIITYFLSGLIGAVAETGCIIIVSNRFADKLGTVMASVGTVCGVGCMVGPLLGGAVYDAAANIGISQFLFPFLVFGALMAILALAMMYIFPNVNITSAEEAAPISSVMTWSMILDIGAVALSGTIVATLDPTLAYRLGTTSEFGMSSSMVGVWFMISSIVYVVASIPVGWLVDRHKGNTLVFKSAIALGFFALAITFAFLGPLKIPGLVTFTVFDNIYCVGFAMCMKGVGSAVSVNPVYPDLVIGLPEDDEMLSATVSGLWNSAYAIGWALGPVVGGAFYNAFGFDGFCSLMSLLCAVYGVVMLVAALMRVTGGWVVRPLHPGLSLLPAGVVWYIS